MKLMKVYCPVCDTLLPDTLICPKCTSDDSGIPILRQRLVLEAIGCRNLDDVGIVYAFLEALSKELGMTLYSQPYVVKTPPQGITGTCIWLESGCIFHSWPEFGFSDLYIESCREFDTEKVGPLVKAFFGAMDIKEVLNLVLGL